MATIDSWQKIINNQKSEFQENGRQKLSQISAILKILAGSPWEVHQVQAVARLFHQLAGSAGFFDLREFSLLASSAEGYAMLLCKKGSDLSQNDIAGLNNFVEKLSFLLQSSEEQENLKSEARMSLSDESCITNDKNRTKLLLVAGDARESIKLAKFFEELSCQVCSYRSQSAAVKAIDESLPDALVLHLPLSEGSGYEVSEHLRRKPGGQKPPVILMSSESGFFSKVIAMRSGVDAFFDAPYDLKQIAERLEYLLERDKPERYRILSVEDDPYQANLIKLTMEAAGYNILVLTDPAEFENALVAFCPDLLLLDIDLGQVNGFELARYVRQNDRFTTLPIIFLTTQNQLEAHIESARAGGDEHLVKPVSAQYLIATVAGRLERYRALKKLTTLDGLTQCLSYASFMDAALKQLERAAEGSRHSIMIFDVDKISQINNQLGFAQGDRVIQALSRVIKRTLRQTEMICRPGEDEFLILLENLDDTEIAQLGEHILYDFAGSKLIFEGNALEATASAGSSQIVNRRAPGLEEAIQKARKSLAIAKQMGSNRLIKAPTDGPG